MQLRYLQMFYYTYLEFDNRREMYILSFMNKIMILAVLNGLCFAEKQNYHYQKSVQTPHFRMLLDLKRFRCLFLLESLMIYDYL